MTDIELYIKRFESFEFHGVFEDANRKDLKDLITLIDKSHFRRRHFYLGKLKEFKSVFESLPLIYQRSDQLKFKKTQQQLIQLTRQIIDENKTIFIVHGRDTNMRDKIEAFLGKLHINNIIFEHETNEGQTIIEKFTKKSFDCQYAIVLMSADDIGSLANAENKQKYRARQNVVLELGYFLGKLGRHKILVLHPDEIEIEKPSDFDGIIYLPYDNKGAWKLKVIKELKAAKFYLDDSDINKV